MSPNNGKVESRTRSTDSLLLEAVYPVKLDRDAKVNTMIATDRMLKRSCVQQHFQAKERPLNKHILMMIH